MRVIFLGGKEESINELLEVNHEYEATESIYSDYYDIEGIGYHLRKDLFKEVS